MSKLTDLAIKKLAMRKEAAKLPVSQVRRSILPFEEVGQAIKDIPETFEALHDPNTYKGMYYGVRDKVNQGVSSFNQFKNNFMDVIHDQPANNYAAPDPRTTEYLNRVRQRRQEQDRNIPTLDAGIGLTALLGSGVPQPNPYTAEKVVGHGIPWHKRLRDNLRYGYDVIRGRRSF